MELQAGPSRTAALGLLAVASVLVAAALLAEDPTGTLLLGAGAVGAAVLGLRDLLLVPVLQADAGGLVVVAGVRRRRLGWDDVTDLRVLTDRRSVLLELDLADETVVVLSRARLGQDPRDVRDALLRLRGA